MAKQTKSKRRHRLRGFIISFLVIGTGILAWWYFFGMNQEEIEVSEVPTSLTVIPQPYRLTVFASGTLEPIKEQNLAFEVSGIVLELPQIGQRVEAGQIIARLNEESFADAAQKAQLDLQKAQAQRSSLASSQQSSSTNLSEDIGQAERDLAEAQRDLVQAEGDLSLSQELYEAGGESAQALKNAQDAYANALSEVEGIRETLSTLKTSKQLDSSANQQDLYNLDLAAKLAQLELDQAQKDLSKTLLTAPFSGVIAEVSGDEGNYAPDNESLLTLIDDSQLELVVQVDETEIAQITLGQSAEITLDAFPDSNFIGQVTAISPIAEIVQNIPVFNVTVTLDNPELKLRPGMSAEAEILVQAVDNSITVPSQALLSVRTRNYLKIQKEDEETLKPVKIITSQGLNVILEVDSAERLEVILPQEEAEPLPENNQRRGIFRAIRGTRR